MDLRVKYEWIRKPLGFAYQKNIYMNGEILVVYKSNLKNVYRHLHKNG